MTGAFSFLVPTTRVSGVCERYTVREVAVFGSAARGDLRPDSDIDLLVEFAPEADLGFIAFNRLAEELSALVGRKVDLVPKAGLKAAIRNQVLAEARLFMRRERLYLLDILDAADARPKIERVLAIEFPAEPEQPPHC